MGMQYVLVFCGSINTMSIHSKSLRHHLGKISLQELEASLGEDLPSKKSGIEER